MSVTDRVLAIFEKRSLSQHEVELAWWLLESDHAKALQSTKADAKYITQLRARIAELEEANAFYQGQAADRHCQERGRIAQLQARITELEEQIASMNEIISDQAIQIISKAERIAGFETLVEKMCDANAELTHRRDELEAALMRASNDCVTMSELEEQHLAAIDQQSERIAELEEQLQTAMKLDAADIMFTGK